MAGEFVVNNLAEHAHIFVSIVEVNRGKAKP